MKTNKHKNLIFPLTVALIAGIVQTNIKPFSPETASATSFCVTDKCKAAEAKEAEAYERANNAAAAADTLEAEVERLGNEIKMYQTRIEKNNAEAEDLYAKITENTAKLEMQQRALANMLVDMHFEGQADAIMILAGSNSISDFAEKQSRVDTVKNQVNLNAQKVKSTKEDLEAQKAEVDRVIADQKVQRAAVERTKKTQEDLVAKYQANAAAYSAEAAAARKAKENEIAAEIARLNTSGMKGSGNNTYPYASKCPRDNLRYSAYGGYVCQCTSYAGWKVYENHHYMVSGWGNANTWAINASRTHRVDHTPAPGTVAVYTGGVWGHVMWVESVNSNGTINLSEYNNSGSSASGLKGDFGYRIGVSPAGLQFIHF